MVSSSIFLMWCVIQERIPHHQSSVANDWSCDKLGNKDSHSSHKFRLTKH